MAADLGYVIVRILHVAGAVMWYGGGLGFMLFGMGGVRRLQGRPRHEAHAALLKKSAIFFSAIGLTTVIFGFVLAHRIYGSWSPGVWSHAGGSGKAVAMGMPLAIVSLLLGPVHAVPMRKIQKALAGPWTAASEAAASAAERTLSIIDHVDVGILTVVLLLMIAGVAGAF